MAIEEQLNELAQVFNSPIEQVQKYYDETLTKDGAEYPDMTKEALEGLAYDAVFSRLHRGTSSVVRVYNGMILATDGKINDYAKRTYSQVQKMTSAMTFDEAKKKRLKNARGQLLYPAGSFSEGRIINADEVYFRLYGVAFEKNNVKMPFVFYVYNTDLLNDVVLNKPVQFHASRDLRGTRSTMTILKSVEHTVFTYLDQTNLDKDLSMKSAETIFPIKELKDVFSLKTKKEKKEKDEPDSFEYDRKFYLFKDMIVTNITKNVRSTNYVELAHPSMMDWEVVALFEPVKSDYDIIRDYKADIFGKVIAIEEEQKKIVLVGAGAWQKALYRQNHKVTDFDPSKTKMTFKI